MTHAEPAKTILKSLIPRSLWARLRDSYHAIKNEIAYQRVKCRQKPFLLNGKTFRYFSNHYNQTYYNERAVEIPIALWYLQRYRGRRILEVGNVLGHYVPVSHMVVDKFEKSERVVNVDIIDYMPQCKFDLILSLSTFEHIGFDESRYAADGRFNDQSHNLLFAVDRAKRLLAPGGVFFLTLPLGFNQFLDEQIAHGGLGMTHTWFLKRVSKRNWWKQVPFEDVRGIRYEVPFRSGANGLVVAQYVNAL